MLDTCFGLSCWEDSERYNLQQVVPQENFQVGFIHILAKNKQTCCSVTFSTKYVKQINDTPVMTAKVSIQTMFYTAEFIFYILIC